MLASASLNGSRVGSLERWEHGALLLSFYNRENVNAFCVGLSDLRVRRAFGQLSSENLFWSWRMDAQVNRRGNI